MAGLLARSPLSPAGGILLARGLAVVGFGLLAKVLLEVGIATHGGVGGTDAVDYWLAGRHAAAGEPLYELAYGNFMAYSYPPLFAQAMALPALLPAPAFVWLWRAVELCCLRFVAGTWTRAGIALLVFPPAIAEIETGNIHLVMAAVCALAMRGLAAPVVPGALLKFASVPLVPLAWVRDRRGLLVGATIAIGVVAVSVAIAPAYWMEYMDFLGANQLPSVPAEVGSWAALPLRLAAAAALGVAAVRWVRLAPIAVVLAYPVVWQTALSTLVAVAARVPARRPDIARSRVDVEALRARRTMLTPAMARRWGGW